MERGLLANFKDIVINENDKFIYSFIKKKSFSFHIHFMLFLLPWFSSSFTTYQDQIEFYKNLIRPKLISAFPSKVIGLRVVLYW